LSPDSANHQLVVAIDGYSSCGKSTLAKALAKRLNFAYIDTGAMYRAVSLYLLRNQIDWQNCSSEEINHHLDQISIEFRYNADFGFSETYLNGELVEDEIRGKEVSQAVSEVSQLKAIRTRMVALQREAGQKTSSVLDGRDIGTHVFPDADLKIFMTADPEVRANRRYQELLAKGKAIRREEVVENIKLRDKNDTGRKENPLQKADDAVLLDNSNMNQEEQLEYVLQLLRERKLID